MGLFMTSESASGNYVSPSDDLIGVTGQLFVKTTPTPLSFDSEYKDQLWRWTVETVDDVTQAGAEPSPE